MHIAGFQIWNYKSFRETDPLVLTRGINIVTGQNNVGKTALLEALMPTQGAVPHRSINTLPSRTTRISEMSRTALRVTLSNAELLQAFAGSAIYAPLPAAGQNVPGMPSLANYDSISLEQFRQWFSSLESYTFELWLERTPHDRRWILPTLPSFGIYKPHSSAAAANINFVRLNVDQSFQTALHESRPVEGSREHEIGLQVAALLPNLIYRFTAERFNVGWCQVGNNPVLAPQAANLPEVLDVLQGNHVAFDRFFGVVRQVLPQIGRVTVAPYAANQRRILVWSESAYREAREDLAFGLNESGTGIGQVLAILYVVLTSNTPQVILIDEPQSFLHPGAARKLIEVLKAHPNHQYIVATHSPTIVTAAHPATIILVTHDGNESRLKHLDSKQADDLRLYLDEIGASLADVFGADAILWVEGLTEERCYALIVENVLKRPLMGKVIKATIATGDFEGRHADRFLEIYNRLSGAQSLLPPAIAFIFDDEGRSEADKKILEHRGGGLVRFTKRRMYENYLLDVRAISAVLNTTEGHTEAVGVQDIQEFIDKCLEDDSFFHPLEKSGGINWIRGDVLLKRLFIELGKLDYRKTTHSVELTRWLIDNDPEALNEISGMLSEELG